MKVTYINVNTNILLAKDTDKVFGFLSKKLLECGFIFSAKHTIQGTFEQISSALNNTNDNIVFIVGDANSIRNYSIKTYLSRYLKVQLTKNINILKTLQKYYQQNDIPYRQENENESCIPTGAIHLINLTNELQGFIFKTIDKIYIFIPNDITAVEYIYENQLITYLNSIINSDFKVTTFKTFGISEKDLLVLIKDYVNNKLNILITTYADDLDITINVRYQSNINPDEFHDYMSGLLSLINKFVYSDENISIYKTAYDLLKLTNNNLGIFESSSLGDITKQMLDCDNNSKNYITNSNFASKEKTLISGLDLNKQIINEYGLISVETTYEIAVSMLQKYSNKLVICTWGEIPQNYSSNNTVKCFIAVGDNDGIHVYKNNFTGKKDAIIKNISKSSIFYLIKKIKQNDLLFNQTIV